MSALGIAVLIYAGASLIFTLLWSTYFRQLRDREDRLETAPADIDEELQRLIDAKSA